MIEIPWKVVLFVLLVVALLVLNRREQMGGVQGQPWRDRIMGWRKGFAGLWEVVPKPSGRFWIFSAIIAAGVFATYWIVFFIQKLAPSLWVWGITAAGSEFWAILCFVLTGGWILLWVVYRGLGARNPLKAIGLGMVGVAFGIFYAILTEAAVGGTLLLGFTLKQWMLALLVVLGVGLTGWLFDTPLKKSKARLGWAIVAIAAIGLILASPYGYGFSTYFKWGVKASSQSLNCSAARRAGKPLRGGCTSSPPPATAPAGAMNKLTATTYGPTVGEIVIPRDGWVRVTGSFELQTENASDCVRFRTPGGQSKSCPSTEPVSFSNAPYLDLQSGEGRDLVAFVTR